MKLERKKSMPELSRFYGIIVKMYFNDTQQHHKPHIHAFYGDYEAVIAVDGELLAGSIPETNCLSTMRTQKRS